ncbi:MAG: TonB-dependent receptor [Prevotella sp.]|nr:TonB-dependent receptor [Prevotella sp.]
MGGTEYMADSSRIVDLDEVIIIAQPKDVARLRQQPLSSTMISTDEMEHFQLRSISDAAFFVPSLAVPDYGSRLTSSMYIRGIGSRINNPAVGVYYDNIPLTSKAAFNSHIYMLDRMDILRGPQGTLYGQNSEGGLIRLYSKNPMNYQGTDIKLAIGTGLYGNAEIAHYHRPSDKLAFSVAGFYKGLKGFISNQNFDQKNDLTNEAGGRLHLFFQPDGKARFDWTADYQYVNQNGFGYGEMTPDGSNVADPATTLMNGYKRNMLNTGLNIATGIGGDLAEAPLVFNSTFSFQYLKDLMVMDQDYMTPDYLRLTQRQKMSALTMEHVLRSQNNNSWQHATGLFGSYQYLRTDAPVMFGDAITGPIGSAIENAMKGAMQRSMYAQILQQMLAQGMPQAAAEAAANRAVQAALEGITMRAEMEVPEHFRTPQTSLALFHESNLQLNDKLKLTLGLRLNCDKVEIDYDALAYMNLTGGTAERQATYHLTSHVADSRSKTYTQLLPKLGLTYTISEQLGNMYAIVAKGYRTGGYNIQMFSDILQADLNANQQNAMRGDYDVEHTTQDYDNINETIAYKPEESWNYEVGTHLNLFDSQLHFDLAIFYMEIRNQQLSVMSPEFNYGRIMVNAGKSHSCGLETTLRGRAVDNALDWTLTYSFTNAKFDEYRNEISNADGTVSTQDFKDKYVPFVPQHTFSALVDWHLTDKLTLGASFTGQGKTWWDEANTFSQKLYTLLGAHADYDFGAVAVSLWGRNLTDTSYNTFAVASSAAGGQRYFAQRGMPLQLGLDVRMHF